jgi:hypothetical protein
LLEVDGGYPAASRAAAEAFADAEDAALEADLDDAERAAEAALEVLEKAELAALEAEEREEEALEDFAMLEMIDCGCKLVSSQCSSQREIQVQEI